MFDMYVSAETMIIDDLIFITTGPVRLISPYHFINFVDSIGK